VNLKNKLSANWRVGLTGAALAVFLGLGCLFFPPGKALRISVTIFPIFPAGN